MYVILFLSIKSYYIYFIYYIILFLSDGRIKAETS